MVKSKIYKVGGAVRDLLLGKKPQDNDYVVVGSTPEDMKQKGFYEIGKGFPVFLHPKTHEEYALARKEIKTGTKHTDFKFIFDSSITLQEDLARRDFTCNAIAYDMEREQIIDYFGGVDDIKHKVLRHVNSTHFVEDPLRILRLCRFAAQLEFDVSPETLCLCQKMVKQGMLEHLTPERVWQEIFKALQFSEFSRFVEVAYEVGALKFIFLEVGESFKTKDKEKYQVEEDCITRTVSALKIVAKASAMIKFAVLMHNLCKINMLENACNLQSENLIRQVCLRFKIPAKFCKFAILAEKQLKFFDDMLQLNVGELLDFAESLSAGHVCHVDEFIEFCEAEEKMANEHFAKLGEFNKKVCLLRKVCDIVAEIKAQDMPDFETLPKDGRFKDVFRHYKIKILQERL